MATLRDHRTGRDWALDHECLIGRSPACSVRLTDGRVSSQHAAIRWTGDAWVLRDLGSLNGTVVDGVLVTVGTAVPLRRGARVIFGGVPTDWELVDDAPPQVMALELDGHRQAVADGDLVGVPSADDPQVTVLRGRDGRWRLERPDAPREILEHGSRFQVMGGTWLFSCPHAVLPTDTTQPPSHTLDDSSLDLRVSRDEEHVEVTLVVGGRRVDLGSRTHNYVLLTLARHRLDDAAQGIAPGGCGWVYVDDLLRQLDVPATQLNTDIFRIRRQFAALQVLADPTEIVERRPRSRQLRIGIARLTVGTI